MARQIGLAPPPLFRITSAHREQEVNTASTFAWYELLTTDAAAAMSFYTHVVGWTARDSGMPDVSFTLL